jgi:hypothetical protein
MSVSMSYESYWTATKLKSTEVSFRSDLQVKQGYHPTVSETVMEVDQAGMITQTNAACRVPLPNRVLSTTRQYSTVQYSAVQYSALSVCQRQYAITCCHTSMSVIRM